MHLWFLKKAVPYGRKSSLIHAVVLLSTALNPIALRAQDNADEAAIRKLVERSFVAHQKKDLSGVLACWSGMSPQLADIKKTFRRDFANWDETQFANLSFTRWRIEADRASARIRYDRDWREARAKQPEHLGIIIKAQTLLAASNTKFTAPPTSGAKSPSPLLPSRLCRSRRP